MDALVLDDEETLKSLKEGRRKQSLLVKGDEWIYELDNDPSAAAAAAELAPIAPIETDSSTPTHPNLPGSQCEGSDDRPSSNEDNSDHTVLVHRNVSEVPIELHSQPPSKTCLIL
eukprot:NODE_6776_length_501_cov_11.641711_g6610_i0.p1 GENE.NODE_6776_length_501_cov_11.641711_g6610_i0~~NODE_6776_length_501_cov_11.641711_g6610_i0.p1  ORF type:complete len:115 (-),score=11.22 NODE_6776_length_501_cov_11.641711_g6610_i0:95-439(-)